MGCSGVGVVVREEIVNRGRQGVDSHAYHFIRINLIGGKYDAS